MIYPNNYEKKIGFDEIRTKLRGNCLCQLGWERVGEMEFMASPEDVNRKLGEIRELRKLKDEDMDFVLQDFYDVRQSIARLRLKNTHMEEQELFELMKVLITVGFLKPAFSRTREDDSDVESDYEVGNVMTDTDKHYLYPHLADMAKGVRTYREIIRRINSILDKFGHIKDSASSALFHIRGELRRTEGSVSRTLQSILRSAQQDGLVERDVTPAMRDGRLVIPISPAMKRRIPGIVHDESATGKTLFIEPTAVVEANNKIRELEANERREVIRILTEVSDELRPETDGILETLRFIADVDFLQAKVQLAESFEAIEPEVMPKPYVDWIEAKHPILNEKLKLKSSRAQGAEGEEHNLVPLTIKLERQENKSKVESVILIISGPNAGGKSVCLKTVGLLQYMVQCGLSVPMSERSKVGVFQNIMIDIGDEQSIEDDLSTYSSHLQNMKMMIKHSDSNTLLLIDEFGTGTEPQIGGAIAEAVLKQFWKNKSWGIITTHYQNLKHFAEDHPGVINGAMLYDRHEMKALFQLQIGRPGSSFAIEIARKTGIPEEVIKDASDIVGSDYIQSDKYLQDIVRDKRYWEQKRQVVHQREKEIEKTINRFETSVEEIERERKAILRRAKEQAEELLKEANKRIENTIREIREAEAEKEATRRLREEMQEFRDEVNDIDTKATDAEIEKKMLQILARRERKAKRKEKAAQEQLKHNTDSVSEKNIGASSEVSLSLSLDSVADGNGIAVGSYVKIKGTKNVGIIESLKGKWAVVAMGDMRTRMLVEKLENTQKPIVKEVSKAVLAGNRATREVIDAHRNNFRQEIDVRGMRGDEALMAVQHFIDDAILVGVSSVRILHGKGNGILRQLIRDYLNALPNVIGCRDEHVQFGGAGITVVDMD